MILIKWGGSVLSNKHGAGPPEVRRQVVARLAAELRSVARRHDVILVLGAGSFGHPAALEAGVGRRRLTGAARERATVAVQASLCLLRRAVVNELWNAGVAAVEVPGAALARGGRIDARPLAEWARAGLVPVTGGDLIPDARLGLRILSGDEIVAAAARAGGARRAVFVTDVEGVRGPRGLLKRVRSQDLARLPWTHDAGDATGSMQAKVAAALRIAAAGVPVWIVSAAPGRLTRAALGRPVVGTRVG